MLSRFQCHSKKRKKKKGGIRFNSDALVFQMEIAATGVTLPMLSWLSVIAELWWSGAQLRARWSGACSVTAAGHLGECQLLFQREMDRGRVFVSLCGDDSSVLEDRREWEQSWQMCARSNPGWESAVSISVIYQLVDVKMKALSLPGVASHLYPSPASPPHKPSSPSPPI